MIFKPKSISNKKIKAIVLFFLVLVLPISKLVAQELKFNHLTVTDGLPQNSIHAIAKDKYGFMWFGTWCGVCRYDGYSFNVFRANENDPTTFADNMINAIVTDKSKNIWIKTGEPDCLYKFSYEYETFKRFSIKNVAPYILDLVANPKSVENKKFKFTTDEKGLKQLNKSNGQEILYKVNSDDPFSISDTSIYTSFLDGAENLWIGTRRGGVNHANLNLKPFNYYHTEKNGKGLISNEVRAVCKDKKGGLWIGSEDSGVTLIEGNGIEKKYSYFNYNKVIDSRRIRSLYCDKYGLVWIGTKGGLEKYDPLSKTIKHYGVNKKVSGGITSPIVFAIKEDSQGSLWIGTYSGMAKYDRTNDKFVYVSPKVTGGIQIRVIMEDHKKNLWIATEDNGLTMLTHTTSSDNFPKFKSKRYTHKDGNDKTIITNRLYSLAEDNDGMIWIATNLGLSRLDPLKGIFKNFTIKDGLSDDIIMGLLFDGNNSIWISHKKGLTRLNTKTFDFQNFNVNDGLQSNEFNQNSCFRDNKTGEMFFGGQNGLNSFFPDSIKINRKKPPIVLTRLNVMNEILKVGTTVNDRIILEKSLLCTDEITLSWWDRTFTLEFAALDYSNPQGNKYKYKLDGIDKEWIFTDASTRTASYSHLPPGNYTFKVYGSNSDGIWSDKPAILHIKILAPWWFSWWAIVFYAIIILVLVVFIYRYIVTRIEFSKNEEIHRSKLQFFTGISHEFRTPLTLIIDPLEKLISGNTDKDTAKQYYTMMQRNAKQLLLLINELLDFRKLESGHLTLNLEQSDIIAFVKTVAATFESLASDRNISFTIESEVSSLTTHFDTAKMNMVLNNLISNAFKFTSNGGEITINITIVNGQNNILAIKVRDSGIGISEEEQTKVFTIFYQSADSVSQPNGSGVGLALTKELVELHGGEIKLKSKVGQGSVFSVFIPFVDVENEERTSIVQQIHSIQKENNSKESIPPNVPTNLPILLIIDDNIDIRNYLELNLGNDYSIVMAANGSEGLELATERIPDLIVSDVMMPGINGLELCSKLKSDERTSHIPIILLTAKHSDESKEEGYETGADAYVTKPFNSNVLKAQIKNLLGQRQRLRELFSQGSAIEIKKIAINTTDEAFINKVIQRIYENLEDEEFNIDALSELLNMSRSQFYRKIKALTNQSLLDFVTTIRMNKALEYLLSGEYNISETAHKVGYSMSSNFTRTFTRHYGVSPSKYIENLKK